MPTSSSSSPARASARASVDALVRAHHVDELVADAHHRVERVHRALEDHRDVAPAVAGAAPRGSCRRGPRRGRGCCRRRSAPGGRRICMTAFATVRLAAAGLAGEADDLARADRRGRRRRRRARRSPDAVLDRRAAAARAASRSRVRVTVGSSTSARHSTPPRRVDAGGRRRASRRRRRVVSLASAAAGC